MANGDAAMADEQVDIIKCAACEQPMLDSEGRARELRSIAHSCSACKKPLHAPLCARLYGFL
eukprot:4927141-Pleurochrysis_carterae.AAC.1